MSELEKTGGHGKRKTNLRHKNKVDFMPLYGNIIIVFWFGRQGLNVLSTGPQAIERIQNQMTMQAAFLTSMVQRVRFEIT